MPGWGGPQSRQCPLGLTLPQKRLSTPVSGNNGQHRQGPGPTARARAHWRESHEEVGTKGFHQSKEKAHNVPSVGDGPTAL